MVWRRPLRDHKGKKGRTVTLFPPPTLAHATSAQLCFCHADTLSPPVGTWAYPRTSTFCVQRDRQQHSWRRGTAYIELQSSYRLTPKKNKVIKHKSAEKESVKSEYGSVRATEIPKVSRRCRQHRSDCVGAGSGWLQLQYSLLESLRDLSEAQKRIIIIFGCSELGGFIIGKADMVAEKYV